VLVFTVFIVIILLSFFLLFPLKFDDVICFLQCFDTVGDTMSVKQKMTKPLGFAAVV